MIQEIAIKTNEKNNLKSSNEKNDIGQIFEKKLLTIKAADNVVRILPPLNVSNKEITIALKIIEKVCNSYK